MAVGSISRIVEGAEQSLAASGNGWHVGTRGPCHVGVTGLMTLGAEDAEDAEGADLAEFVAHCL